MADVSQIKLPNGDTFDLIDEKSGYITAQYIENRTDYSIPVSRVGEIVVGETAIGTDSTNFPTSKAVVDYVDERVVQEIGAIDVGVTGIKANGTSLAVNNGVVNIPVAGKTQTIGLMDFNLLASFQDYLESQIPTSTSQLTNDSGFITSETDPVFSASAAAGITSTDISNWNAKVSDDKTWNGVSLTKGAATRAAATYLPQMVSTTATSAALVKTTSTPEAYVIPKYDGNTYLYSATPSANDNSTKVATTAYVDSTVPKIHIIDLAYEDTIDDKSIYNSGDFTNQMIKGYIDNNEIVILKMYKQFYYFDAYDRGVSDLTFVAQNFGDIGKDVLTPYKESGGAYSNKWRAFASDLPIYDGTVE